MRGGVLCRENPVTSLPKPWFLTSALLTLGAREFFVVGGWPVHHTVFSSISELYSLDASDTPSVVTTQNASRQVQILRHRNP